MRHKKRVVSAAAGSSDKAVKPMPPEDMWEALAEALHEVQTGKKAKDEFTMLEFGAKFQLSREATRRRLEKMIAAGKLERRGAGKFWYYRLVEGG